MPGDRINFSKRDNVAIITLNRPEARNALTPQMVADLGRAVRSCGRPDVRVVLITGAGDAFCAGADVKEFEHQLSEGGPESLSHHVRSLADALHREVILGIRRLEKPVVAAINGVAAGGGFSLMLACDLRLAADNARFLMAYANIGTTADGGSTYLLPRLVGAGKAMEIYLASQPISAERALEIGLVNQVCPSMELEQHAMETVARLAQGPTRAYAGVKSLLERSWSSSLEGQLDAETEAIASMGLTSDFQEGIRAFVEKRRPRFLGR